MPARGKGVANIRTLASVRGCGVHSNERHVHQFQIASLELERSRRLRERQCAMNRVNDIDARLREVDALMLKHQEALGISVDERGCDKPQQEIRVAVSREKRILRY
jgi:hypothetical protein